MLVLTHCHCAMQADCFSFGVCLWEICTRDIPMRGYLRDVHAPAECPEDIRALLADCMASDPAKRPSAEELVSILACFLRSPVGSCLDISVRGPAAGSPAFSPAWTCAGGVGGHPVPPVIFWGVVCALWGTTQHLAPDLTETDCRCSSTAGVQLWAAPISLA